MGVRDKTKENEELLRDSFKKWRKQFDLSLSDVASMLNGKMTPQFLSQFERWQSAIGYENGIALDRLIEETQP